MSSSRPTSGGSGVRGGPPPRAPGTGSDSVSSVGVVVRMVDPSGGYVRRPALEEQEEDGHAEERENACDPKGLVSDGRAGDELHEEVHRDALCDAREHLDEGVEGVGPYRRDDLPLDAWRSRLGVMPVAGLLDDLRARVWMEAASQKLHEPPALSGVLEREAHVRPEVVRRREASAECDGEGRGEDGEDEHDGDELVVVYAGVQRGDSHLGCDGVADREHQVPAHAVECGGGAHDPACETRDDVCDEEEPHGGDAGQGEALLAPQRFVGHRTITAAATHRKEVPLGTLCTFLQIGVEAYALAFSAQYTSDPCRAGRKATTRTGRKSTAYFDHVVFGTYVSELVRIVVGANVSGRAAVEGVSRELDEALRTQEQQSYALRATIVGEDAIRAQYGAWTDHGHPRREISRFRRRVVGLTSSLAILLSVLADHVDMRWWIGRPQVARLLDVATNVVDDWIATWGEHEERATAAAAARDERRRLMRAFAAVSTMEVMHATARLSAPDALRTEVLVMRTAAWPTAFANVGEERMDGEAARRFDQQAVRGAIAAGIAHTEVPSVVTLDHVCRVPAWRCHRASDARTATTTTSSRPPSEALVGRTVPADVSPETEERRDVGLPRLPLSPSPSSPNLFSSGASLCSAASTRMGEDDDCDGLSASDGPCEKVGRGPYGQPTFPRSRSPTTPSKRPRDAHGVRVRLV